MRFDFFKKQLGLKIVLFLTSGMVAFSALLLFVISRLDVQVHTPAALLKAVAVYSLLFLFFQVFLLLLAVATFVTKPLAQVQHAMERVLEGNLSMRLGQRGADEFNDLAATFDRLMTGLNDREAIRRRTEQRLMQAEEHARLKPDLENKAATIQKMNRELTIAFEDLSLLFRVSEYLNRVVESDELITTVQGIFTEHFKCDQFALLLLSKDGAQLNLATQKGLFVAGSVVAESFPLDHGVCARAARERKSQYYPDIGLPIEPEFNALEKRCHGALFCVPVLVHNELIGVLMVVRHTVESFTPTDRQSLESIVSQIAIAYDRSQLYGMTKELSVRDELTGIYNRRYFHQRLDLELKRAERFKRNVSLLMIDVDHFKKFNDTYGHLKGDEVLKRLTQLIETNIREIDLFARFGGEEFVLVLADTTIQDAVIVANKLRELVATQLELTDISESGPKTPALTVSIGVSSYPVTARDHEDLINTADIALYMAKKRGRDQVFCYQANVLPLDEMMAKMGFIH